jgi:hypothetical protein
VERIEDAAHGVGGKTPTRWSTVVFAIKVSGLRLQRWMHDFGSTVRRWPIDRHSEDVWHLRGELRSRLWSDVDKAERLLELGKVENLRRACSHLNGVVIDARGTFSFWRQIGKASERKGFVMGRMLQQGCVVPAIGGGLCQLSNSLYGLALRNGADIVERHAHSIKMPDAPAHDATVAWNYIDLRFRVRERTRIRAWMSSEELIVEWQAEDAVVSAFSGWVQLDLVTASESRQIQSCASCGVTECFRHESPQTAAAFEECTAYLVGSDLAEFDEYIQRVRKPGDIAMLKCVTGSQAVEHLAAQFEQALRPEVTHLCVSRNLLPWLWRKGAMGGRTFDVLTTTAPEPMMDPLLMQDDDAALKAARHLIVVAAPGDVSTTQSQRKPETIGV